MIRFHRLCKLAIACLSVCSTRFDGVHRLVRKNVIRMCSRIKRVTVIKYHEVSSNEIKPLPSIISYKTKYVTNFAKRRNDRHC